MALVDYSGSDESDDEEPKSVSDISHDKSTANKPAFPKVVDRSNPHKVKINLRESAKTVDASEKNDRVQRPGKRAKIEKGGTFNSFLPAPKRVTVAGGGNNAPRLGLAGGVSLKTGSTPGFTREPMLHGRSGSSGMVEEENDASSKIAERATEDRTDTTTQETTVAAPSEEQPKKTATIFKPLSVARKPAKRKAPLGNRTTPSAEGQIEQLKPAPKISLFSSGLEKNDHEITSSAAGTYQPMIYQAPLDPLPSTIPSTPDVDSGEFPDTLQPLAPADPDTYNQGPQSLDSIASDLNLSASARRQLLGRHGTKDPSAIRITNFNTDEEYAANEQLRQAGETVKHNPLRAIQPGKHSLKSLVSAVATQKDALEEQFATGRRNKKEAGGKYGW